MSKKNWEKVEIIIDEVLNLPAEERTNFIDEQCNGDDDLKSEVTLLLESIFESEGWLDNPEEYQELISKEIADDIEQISLSDSLIGQTVGSYTIKKELGKGGMGSVYLAERSDGAFDHQVAIKVIHQHKATKENILRFEQERNILAELNHPGIAKLFDGGITSDGFPYLIMEYIDGMSITQYCEYHNLALNARLTLFKKILKAVRHAHENAVIHRDLKPGNILVTKEGEVKILDFGISKMVDNDSSAHLTQTKARLLTPRYAAPEQIKQQPVTTATDLYALGIIFYQLLCGEHPFDLEDLSQYDMEQVILEREPVSPHSKVSDPFPITKKQLQGDLDAIALKAIRKEPARRYRVANQFLDDLSNYQKGLPVSAHADSFKYRAHKLFQRHKAAVGTMAGILLLIIGLVGFYTVRITKERNRAQLEAEKAEQVSGFLVNLFSQSNPYFQEAEGGLDLKVGSILKYGAEKINKELNGQPKIQAELKKVIGEVFYQLGEFAKAETLLTESLRIRKRIYDKPNTEIAESMKVLAFLYQEEGDFNQAESLLTKSISIFEKDKNDLLSPEALSAMNMLGNLLWFNKGNYSAADSVLHRTLKLRRKLYNDKNLNIAKNLNDIATLYHVQGQYEAAEPFYRKSIEMYKRFYDDHSNLAIIMSNFSALLREQGLYEEAEKFQRDALKMHRKVTGEKSIDVALGLGSLGHILMERGLLIEADKLLKEALVRLTEIYGTQHPYVSRTKLNLGRLYLIQKQFNKSKQMLLEVNEDYQQIFPAAHPKRSDPLLELGLLNFETENFERAKEYLKKAHQIRTKGYPKESWRVAQTMSAYGFCLSRLGDFQKADSLLKKSFEQLKTKRGAEDKYTQVAHSRLIEHQKLWNE